jgi:hypothetical protein
MGVLARSKGRTQHTEHEQWSKLRGADACVHEGAEHYGKAEEDAVQGLAQQVRKQEEAQCVHWRKTDRSARAQA